jgi:thiol-disulfide isomerase/thioredoxin
MSESDVPDGRLETMRPNPVWTADAYEGAVDAWRELADDVTVRVWGGDWCKDCRRQLPDFAAGLDAAGVPEDRIKHYPVEKADEGNKTGPRVEEYGIELIPTVVVERDGEELARFVEDADRPLFVYLAEELERHA